MGEACVDVSIVLSWYMEHVWRPYALVASSALPRLASSLTPPPLAALLFCYFASLEHFGAVLFLLPFIM
jgi:hypothetical protein